MGKRILAVVEGLVLSWARESAGYSVADIAERLGKSARDVEDWEAGRGYPSISQIRKLAGFYKRPISDFYLPAPPKERPLPHDFRHSPGEISGHYSPALRVQLRLARERQDIAKYLHEDMRTLPPKFSHRVESSQSPEVVGLSTREILGITLKDQHNWAGHYATLKGWRKRIEKENVLVFQFEDVEAEEAWGFSVVDEVCPIIGINKNLSPNARTFTMLHEFTHLLLNKSAVCDIDDYTPRAPEDIKVEIFCNHVAAATLMPEEEFKSNSVIKAHEKSSTNWSDDEIKNIASAFGVSREAATRRLLTFNLTTSKFYREKRSQFHAEFYAKQERERERRRAQENLFSGPSRAQRAVSDFGGNFVHVVLDSLSEKRITLADAAQYLKVMPPAISQVQELMLPER